jgi:hypothetical protein
MVQPGGKPTRVSRKASLREKEIAFLRREHDQIYRTYASKWIVVEGEEVVGADEDMLEAGRQAKARGIKVSFFVRIPSPDEPLFIG